MTAANATICLNMIVRNEAPVIRRCLDSVLPIINQWVIVDTGSTDGTQDIIRDHLRDIPGTLFERPWRDFAHNRTEALNLARGRCDYALIIDADDMLEIPDGFVMPPLDANSYLLTIHDGPLNYHRVQMVRSELPWRYEGVLHEYLTCEGAGAHAELAGIRMRRNHDGARRKDPLTYRRDAEVLEAAIETEPNPFLVARYRFYLAQSYRDCGEYERAIHHYQLRAKMGFWQEEVFISLYEAGKLMERLGQPDQVVIDTHMHAFAALPTRAESLHAAARFCRVKGHYEAGYTVAKRGIGIEMPKDALFVEPWIYQTGLLDEFAVNASWCGHDREALDANLKLLAGGHLRGTEIQRIAANAAGLAAKVLRDQPNAPRPALAPAEPARPAIQAKQANLGSAANLDFLEQHPLPPARSLRSPVPASAAEAPRVLVAILAKQKEASLPLYLKCIEALDYPKSAIVLYIRTNNNTDRTAAILFAWLGRVRQDYARVIFDPTDVETPVEKFGVHEWNPTRFAVLARIRDVSLRQAIDHDCQFYFVADCDNFIRPGTLRELVALNLPIVAPLLRHINPIGFYANYHTEIDDSGYFRESDQYQWILQRWVRGVLEVPVVHCTYLIRRDVIGELGYEDGSDRHEYVIFSDRARRAGIPQYLDNRQLYGYVHFEAGGAQPIADGVARAAELLARADDTPVAGPAPATPGERTLLFCTCFAPNRDVWRTRYRRWLGAIQKSALRHDQILMIDDGSPEPPDWDDVAILPATDDAAADSPVLMLRFPDNLGRAAGHNYPGWYRSFAYAATYAKRRGFSRVIHIESDTFVIGDAVADLFNGITDDWVALWDPFFEMPETALQVAAGRGFDRYFAATRQPYKAYLHQVIERVLPFTRVERGLTGAKYPEFLNYVPATAKFVVQATEAYPDDFFWWLGDSAGPTTPADAEAIASSGGRAKILTGHDTVVYADEATWELHHGPIASSPDNIWLAYRDGAAVFVLDDGKQPPAAGRVAVFTALRGRMMTPRERDAAGMPAFLFDMGPREGDKFGLRSGTRYLCAEPDGRIGLSRKDCMGWELFRLGQHQADRSDRPAVEAGSEAPPAEMPAPDEAQAIPGDVTPTPAADVSGVRDGAAESVFRDGAAESVIAASDAAILDHPADVMAVLTLAHATAAMTARGTAEPTASAAEHRAAPNGENDAPVASSADELRSLADVLRARATAATSRQDPLRLNWSRTPR